MLQALWYATLGTGFTFLMTAAGAGVVIFCKRNMNVSFHSIFLGFASGVMLAASVWSLLLPAIDSAEEQGMIGYVPAAGGFLIGCIFLWMLDTWLPSLCTQLPAHYLPQGYKHPTLLLMLSVTLHNIPEGMAVGLACGLAASGADSSVTIASAAALAMGIGLQNFPEGAAISLPLHQEGFTRKRSFVYGALSGIVEPIGGLLAVLIASSITPLMPWFLSFAAGAMVFVVVEHLIPSAQQSGRAHVGTAGVVLGFLVMMVLDVALG